MAPPEWDLLLSAAQKNQPSRIRELIARGVDPNHANGVGQSAVHIAALWGHVKCVQDLLEAGANSNAKNQMMGRTPLHMVAQSQKATTEDFLAVVDLLVKHGADVNLTDDQGFIPLDFYKECGGHDPRLMEKLEPRQPPLFEAISNHDVAAVKTAIAGKPGSVHSEYRRKTVLDAATDMFLQAVEEEDVAQSDRSLEILQVLLGNGSDPNWASPQVSLDMEARTPPFHRVLESLRQAFKTGKDDQFTALLEKTARLFQSFNATVTPESLQLLHDAARRNEVRMVRFLIEELGFDPNAQGRQRMTALQFAARSGQTETILYLLSIETIKIDLTDDHGKTALDAAIVNERYDVVEILQQYMRDHGGRG